MASSLSNEFKCPNCGADIHPNARACKKCGVSASSPSTRWHQPEHIDGVDLPPEPDNDADFDYDDFVAREFSDDGNRPIVIDARKIIWWLTAVILFIVFLCWSTGVW